MAGFGVPELLIILLVIIVIFGAGKLPQISNALGRSIRDFKTSVKDESEIKDQADDPVSG